VSGETNKAAAAAGVNVIDCRGLACPQPVIMTKRALEAAGSGSVAVIVDNPTARENVAKFARAGGHAVEIAPAGEGLFRLTITKGAGAAAAPPGAAPGRPAGSPAAPAGSAAASVSGPAAVYLISQETLGAGSPELGAVLMKSLLFTLLESDAPPRAIIFINGGVKLAVKGSPVLEHLRGLAARGVNILACGTCLDYFQLKDQLAVGTVSNMYAITAELAAGAPVVAL